MKLLVFLAKGFETIEFSGFIDVLGMGQLIEDFAGFGQFAVLAFWLIGDD